MSLTNEEIIAAVVQHGGIRPAARSLGLSKSELHRRHKAAAAGLVKPETPEPFTVAPLPPRNAPIDDILARRKVEFARVDAAMRARHLIDVQINMGGPIGISHFGDPHLDDPGCDIAKIERDSDIVRRTEGLFAANIGDTTNAWVGRLSRLYSEQGTTEAESWALAEWFITRNKWAYVVAGNHDVWHGPGSPLNWIARGFAAVHEPHGVRLNLKFPNGREVRVNARHDFKGSSGWNTVHGVAKAAMTGWQDHILICGHLHISGYQVVKAPTSGLLSHCIRVAAYKTHDRYAEQLGLRDQNFSENIVTVIDPEATDERRLVTVFFDLAEGAEYLSWKRQRWAGTKPVAFSRAPAV